MRDQIDALDELREATQQILRRAVADARAGDDGQPASAGVRLVFTARPGAPTAGRVPDLGRDAR